MSPDTLILHEGAILVADAHYSFKHPLLLDFLQTIHTEEIITPQLILMGDIFDLLFTDIALTLERNRVVIDLINALSEQIEVVYLEGNHDFNLGDIFPGVKVYSLRQQPVEAGWMGQRVGLAHGDFGGAMGYKIYTALIRNRLIQKMLNSIDSLGNHFIINALDYKLKNKEDCRSIERFETYVKKHLSQVDLNKYDYFIEGHFHQNAQFDIEKCRYINLAAFACHEHYFVVQSEQMQSILRDMVFQREK